MNSEKTNRITPDLTAAALDLTPRATHSFDTRRSAGRGYIYACTCPEREHALTLHRHNKIRRGQGYLCRDCKGLLHFLHKEKSLLHKDKSVTQS